MRTTRLRSRISREGNHRENSMIFAAYERREGFARGVFGIVCVDKPQEFAVDKSNAPIIQENHPIWRSVQQGAHLGLGALGDWRACHLRVS